MKQRSKIKYPGIFISVLLVLAIAVPSAGAVVVNGPSGRVSYFPLNEAAAPQAGSPLGFTVPTGSPPLIFHGGPVMPSHEAFAIFWAPSGFSFPSGYEAAITKYFEDVAADSGKSTNVYSVSAQYSGSNGFVNYEDTFGGSVVDTTAYPTTGTCSPYTGLNGASYTACLSDAKIKAEVESVVEDQGWPSGLSAAYYVVLPPEVGSCFGTTPGSPCFDKAFCAYHGFASGLGLVYSNISYAPEDTEGCGVGEYPNGTANGLADDTFSSISHEANEAITDPELNAWFDASGFENGDECRNTPFGEDFGPALGGSFAEEDVFNQAIGSSHYYLQQEWSNASEDCAQRVRPALPVIGAPGSANVGQAVAFSSLSSIPGELGIEAAEWDFGDGSGGAGFEVAHGYSAVGTYTVTLTLTDEGGFTYSRSQQIAIKTPEPPSGGGTAIVPAQPGPPPRAPAKGIAVAAGKAKVSGGLVALKLRCRGGGPCSGVVRLLDRGPIGKIGFRLAAGAGKTVRVPLNARGLALLAKASAGGFKVSLSGTGVRARTVTLSASS
ncbi:MAG TPA: PKD domain-containing protein [Solirubrobacterales bacterium]|nr:PKD domain-containing protein [Solirubrobacterales bacterium]